MTETEELTLLVEVVADDYEVVDETGHEARE